MKKLKKWKREVKSVRRQKDQNKRTKQIKPNGNYTDYVYQ